MTSLIRSVRRVDLISELRQQRVQFVETAVNIADDVEWTMFVFQVIPEPLSLDNNLVDLRG